MPRPPKELTPHRSTRHLFGADMRRAREREDMTQEELGAVILQSRSTVGRLEAAEAVIPPDVPAKLDEYFGTDDHFQRLYAVARHEQHPDRYRRRMDLEARAVAIDEFAGHYVPGLLQTEEYASAVIAPGHPGRPDDVRDLVLARLGRQEDRKSGQGAFLGVILDEGVLRRPIGTPDAMRRQLAELAELVDTPRSLIQVAPYRLGTHALLGGSLTLLTLDTGESVAYEESITTGTLIEDPDMIAQHRRAYDRLRALALGPEESAALIRSAMEDLPT